MTRYLLDTNAVINLFKNTHSKIALRLCRYEPIDIGVSSVVMHELFYGAFKSQQKQRNLARIDAFQFEVLEFDNEDARQAGEIRAILALSGHPIGPYDVLIAGQAKARGMTLVSHNITEFKHIEGLLVEDWEEEMT